MRLFLTVLILLVSTKVFAIDEGDIRIGVVGGNVSLMGDPGSGGQNALGTGAIFSYQVVNDIAFNLIYLSSSNSNTYNVKHSDISVGVDYYTGGDGTIAYHLSGGASLLSNQMTISSNNVTGNGMGIYAGAGVDFQLSSRMLFGLKFKYDKAFATTTTVASNTYNTTQDSVDVFAVVSFVLSGKK